MTQQGIKPAGNTGGMGVPKPVAATSRAWSCAAVAIVLLLLMGIPAGYVVIHWSRAVTSAPRAMRDFAVDAMRPKFVAQELVLGTVEDVRRQNKLVVLQTTVTADITRQESASSWGVYWGTNTARVIAHGIKTQYYIDLSAIGTSDFVVDDSRKVVTLTVPHPQLDMDMVSIDPGRVETLDLSGGWMRFNKRDTWDHAVAELKPKALIEAGRPLPRKEADEAGKAALMGILSPMVDTLGKNGMTLEIQYRK